MDQKFDNQVRDALVIDDMKVSQLSDESLDNRIASLSEVVMGYDDPDKEGEDFRNAVAVIGKNPIDVYRAALRVLRKERRDRAVKPRSGPRIVPWTPFERQTIDPAQFDTPEAWTRYRALAEKDPQGRTPEQYREVYLSHLSDEHYMNSRYHVVVRRTLVDFGFGPMELVHLSVKRVDQQVIHDWRDLQRIKDELVGEECEGIELFPAQSRCVDTANQYHLWVANDPLFRWPVGWHEGRVQLDDGEGGEGIGQRAFEA